MSELLPCPFCGADAEFVDRKPEHSKETQRWDVCCAEFDCFLSGGADWYLERGEAVRLWNKRERA